MNPPFLWFQLGNCKNHGPGGGRSAATAFSDPTYSSNAYSTPGNKYPSPLVSINQALHRARAEPPQPIVLMHSDTHSPPLPPICVKTDNSPFPFALLLGIGIGIALGIGIATVPDRAFAPPKIS